MSDHRADGPASRSRRALRRPALGLSRGDQLWMALMIGMMLGAFAHYSLEWAFEILW